MPYVCQPRCYMYGHLLVMSYFNLDVKGMFTDRIDFVLSIYDQRVYYHHDERGTVVVANKVDDFTILASSLELQQWTITEI